MNLVFFMPLIFICNLSNAFVPDHFTPNVVDKAGVLNAEEIEFINDEIEKLQSKNIYAAVYFVKTLNSTSIEEAAETTFKKWELGVKGKDNGLLFIFALDDRNARIEVGYGLEGDITDLNANRLLKETILPNFKSGNYFKGVISGLDRLSSSNFNDPVHFSNSVMQSDDDLDLSLNAWLVWVAFLVCGLIYVLIRRLLKSEDSGVKNLSVPTFSAADSNSKTIFSDIGRMIFIAGFLAVNPGIFIYLLFNSVKNFFVEYGNLQQDFETISYFVVIFFLLEFVLIAGFFHGRANKNLKNPNLKSFFGFVMKLFSPIKIFQRYILFAIPYAISVGFMFDKTKKLSLNISEVPWPILIGFAGLVLYRLYRAYLPLAYEKVYLRKQAKARLHRIKTRVLGTRTIFGKTHHYSLPSRSSSGGSSSSSSSSRSSSSGGGRSGGGGSSSRW